MAEMSPLRRRMIEDMTVRNLSPATQRSYVHAVAKFGRFFGRSPDRLDLEDVRAFQVHLVAGGISWPALNQTVCALRFLYGVTLKQADLPERIPYAREPRKLPVVLGADEVVRFLEAVPSLKARAALTTAYAAGLRASEAASLKSLPQRRRGSATSTAAAWSSASSRARACPGEGRGRPRPLRHAVAATARHPAFVLAIGETHVLAVSRARSRAFDQRNRAACRLPLGMRGIALPPTCWRAAPTSASSRRCSATAASTRQRATRRWRPAPSAARRARSTGCAVR